MNTYEYYIHIIQNHTCKNCPWSILNDPRLRPEPPAGCQDPLPLWDVPQRKSDRDFSRGLGDSRDSYGFISSNRLHEIHWIHFRILQNPPSCTSCVLERSQTKKSYSKDEDIQNSLPTKNHKSLKASYIGMISLPVTVGNAGSFIEMLGSPTRNDILQFCIQSPTTPQRKDVKSRGPEVSTCFSFSGSLGGKL